MTRAADYGRTPDGFLSATQRLNSNLALIGIVEDALGISNIQEIIALANGLDAVEIGRRDLAAGFDPPSDIESDNVLEKVREGAVAVSQAGMSLGLLLRSVDDASRWGALGANVFIFSSDVQVLRETYNRAFQTVRRLASLTS